MSRRLRELVRDESGIALVMALGISMTLAIVTGSLILYTTSNQSQANRSRQNVNVYAVAQAGIDSAVAQVAAQTGFIPATDPPVSRKLDPTLFSAMPVANRTAALNGGTVTWGGRLFPVSTTRWRWRLTATATAQNPASPGQTLTRTISADLVLRPAYLQTMNNDSWNYVFTKATATPGGCDQTVYNNTTQRTSLYVAGNLCFENSSAIVGPSAPGKEVNLTVMGETNLFGSPVSFIGYDQSPPGRVRPLTSVYLNQGCRSFSNPALHLNCGPADNVWNGATAPAYNALSGSTSLSAPVADFADWYLNAAPGPSAPCDPAYSSGAYPGSGLYTPFDNNPAVARSLGAFDLAPGAAYVCRATMDGDAVIGELAWTPGNPGRLNIKGTVYFDGSGVLDNEGLIDYDGFGALYLSGTLYLRQTRLCGNVSGGNCAFNGWNAADNILVIVTEHHGAPAGAGYGATFAQSQFQGALYTEYPVEVVQSSTLSGPLVAPRVDIRNLSQTQTFPLDIQLPFGTPGNEIVDWVLMPPTNYTG